MDKRYEVFACHGKGVFSIVVRARDVSKRDELGQHPEVAIKLIRANEVGVCVLRFLMCVCLRMYIHLHARSFPPAIVSVMYHSAQALDVVPCRAR